jgi:hypothetical protein
MLLLHERIPFKIYLYCRLSSHEDWTSFWGAFHEEGDRNRRINLTEIGTADWAYWGTQSLDKANEKAGAGEIGELTIIGATSIDQTQWATSWDVDFSDGVDPVSGSVDNVGNRLRLESASEVDEGYEIAVAAGAETRYLDIYFRQKNLVAKFVATLGDDVNEVFLEPPSGSTIHGIYRLDISHPTASELRIRYFLPAGIAPYFGTESDSMRIGCMALSGPRGRAYKLYPKDGSTVDSATVDLQWLPGDYVGADGHRVYLDPNEQKVIGRSGCQVNGVVTTDPSYTVDLTVGETYYWAVDQVNDADPNSPWPGDVSSFTVTAPIYGPTPPDGKKGVHPDVAFLEWNAALAATSYDVYFGTDWNNVNDGTGGTHQGTVTDPRWAVTPSRLAETTTYYWRIDATIGTTTYKGDVWTFTTGIGVNIAWVSDEFGSGLDQDWVALLETQGFTVDYRRGEYWRTLDAGKIAALNDAKLVIVSKATGSGEYSDSNSVGGEEEETLWNNITSPMILLNAMLSGADDWNWFDSNDHEWLGGAPIMEAVVPSHPIFDGVTLVGRKVDVLDETVGSGYTSFMQVTTAGNGTVYARTPDPNGWVWIVEWARGAEFYDGAGQTAGDRRMYFFAGTGGFNPGIYNLTAEGEKVFLNAVDYMRLPVLKAFIPSPLDGATDVKQTPTLRWTPGDKAVQHDVYFGTDEAAVAAADTATPTIYRGRQDLSSYVPTEAPLEWAKTYYWRIDEIEADGVTIHTGEVWSFTVANFVVVDDFESYNDLDPDDPESNRIFNTWLDGYEIPTNGSLVGYENAPFCERTIVHGDNQSMPFFYSNTGTAAYSEAERTFAATQNWTVAGATTLVLYFYGTEGNTGQLYVKVNGSKVVYGGDAADIAKQQWTQWSIDLASLGVDLQNVTKLSIGIDGNGASGTLYFDDIRLYRLAP